MKTKLSIVVSAILGIVIGVLGNYSMLEGRWFNLVVWAAVGLLIGAFIEERRFIRWAGISYGISLSLAFLISGFHGSSNNIFGFAMLTLFLTVIGAFCGWCLVFVGNWLKRTIRRDTL